MVDYSSINFVKLLNRLGLRNVRMTAGGVEVNYSCHRPNHSHGDERPSAYVNSQTGLHMCQACKFHGRLVDLVADVQQVSVASAESFLSATYGVAFDEPVGGSFAAEIDALLRPPLTVIPHIRPVESWLSATRLNWIGGDLEPYQRYIVERGLERETLWSYDVGYDYLSDRLTIPVRDLDGELYGIKGRDWSGRHGAKYLVLGDSASMIARGSLCYGFGTYPKNKVVFGLHRARHIRQAVLVEGELDAIALWQMGVQRPLATGTAQMSARQVQLLVDECEEVVVLYDRDEAGEQGWRQVVEMLEPYISVRVADPIDVDPMDACRDGREQEVLDAIAAARPPLARGMILG